MSPVARDLVEFVSPELWITVDGDLRNHDVHVDGPPPGGAAAAG